MKTVTCTSLFLAAALVAAAGARQSSAPAQTPGPKLSLAFALGKKPTAGLDKCVVDVAIENKGNAALLLDLGVMLGNGTKLLPTAISFDLRNSATGKRIQLVYSGPEPGVAGRVDDFVLGLAPGSAYHARLAMSDFHQAGASGPIKLNGGAYVLTAEYGGAAAGHVNDDMQGLSTLRFWQGTARSKGLPFKCTGSAAAPAAGGG